MLKTWRMVCERLATPDLNHSGSVANWYIYIPDFTNLVYFLDRLVGEIMVWYMSLNLVYFYAFW